MLQNRKQDVWGEAMKEIAMRGNGTRGSGVERDSKFKLTEQQQNM